MQDPRQILQPEDGLLIVDVQNDFCPGGKLAVENGDQVISVLNPWIETALTAPTLVLFSRDWHPREHPSFEKQGGPWPPHCLQDSAGAAFHPELNLPESAVIVTKGVRFDQDQNSAFDQTGLSVLLKNKGIKRLFIGGLALDVCVKATVLHACEAGFEVHLIKEGTRAVTPDGAEEALKSMQEAGAVIQE